MASTCLGQRKETTPVDNCNVLVRDENMGGASRTTFEGLKGISIQISMYLDYSVHSLIVVKPFPSLLSQPSGINHLPQKD